MSIVAAVASNGVIGRDGRLPWRLKPDLARFRRLTMGHTLVMGRRTHESIGRPLDGRRTIVLTRDLRWSAAGVEVARSLEEALALAAAGEGPDGEVFVVGGAEVYARALAVADRVYLTRLDDAYEGDTWFPALDETRFRVVERERHEADPAAGVPCGFELVTYERAPGA